MTYPQWWERLVAAIIDAIILAIVMFVINTILISIGGTSLTAVRLLGFIAVLINTAIIIAYKVFLESGQWQATPGKMVFGLKVVNDAGARATPKEAFMRTWPWWLNILGALGALLLIGSWFNFLIALLILAVFVTFFIDPQGRCIHDTTAKMHVIKAGQGAVA